MSMSRSSEIAQTACATLSLNVPSAHLLLGEYFVTDIDFAALCFASEPRAHCHVFSTPQTKSSLVLDYNNTTQHYSFTHPELFPPLMLECLTQISAHTLDPARNIADQTHSQPTTSPLASHISLASAHKKNTPSNTTIPPFLKKICQTIAEQNVLIHIDSSSFFGQEKRGLGSSECASILACATLLSLVNRNTPAKPASNITSDIAPDVVPGIVPNASVPLCAHRAHTRWQGGNGSGYGCYTSYFGGIGTYHQSFDNASKVLHELHGVYKTHSTTFPTHTYLYSTAHSISSPQSIASWKKARRLNPLYAQKLKERMREAIRYFFSEGCNRDSTRFLQWLSLAQSLSEALGHFVKRESALITGSTRPSTLQDTIHQLQKSGILEYKSLGAGNELFLIASKEKLSLPEIYSTNHTSNESFFPLSISEGIQYTSHSHHNTCASPPENKAKDKT